METKIILPDSLHIAATKLATELAISPNDLYVTAIDSFISRSANAITNTLNEIYAVESSALDPEIEQMQFASIPQNNS